MIEPFRLNTRPLRIVGNTFDIETYNAPKAEAFVDWINARLTELNIDVDAFRPDDQLNEAYADAIQIAQGGQHDNLTKRLRYYVMQQLAAQAIARNPYANVVECGCWQGHSTLLIERAMLTHGADNHNHDGIPWGRLHVFDSFEGLSKPSPEDGAVPLSDFKSSFDALQAKVSDRTRLHKGWIPGVFSEYAYDAAQGRISFASIDVDLYTPTREALAFVYPRLVSGGTIYFDDYGYRVFPGAKLAVDQHVAQHPPAMFIKLATGSAFLVKP